MNRIEIEDGLTLRFPGRDPSFGEGVEIGMLATLMAMNLPEFARAISPETVEQARSLGRKLGYRIASVEPADEVVRVTFANHSRRPRLRLVSSA